MARNQFSLGSFFLSSYLSPQFQARLQRTICCSSHILRYKSSMKELSGRSSVFPPVREKDGRKSSWEEVL